MSSYYDIYICPHTTLLYYGSIKALLRLYYGSITALLRLYYGSVKALLRLLPAAGTAPAASPLLPAASA